MGVLSRLFGGGKAKKREELLVNITMDVDPASLWKTIGELGEGTFGVVRKVRSALFWQPSQNINISTIRQVKHSQTGQLAAAKVIPVENDEELEDYVVEVKDSHHRLLSVVMTPRSHHPSWRQGGYLG